jgi:LPS export ABC transporter protein LptC
VKLAKADRAWPLLLAALGLAAACKKQNDIADVNPRQVMTNFSMDQSNPQTRIWHLIAEKAILVEADERAYLTQPRMLFYKENKPDTRVRSKTGVIQTETHDVLLSSSVVAISMKDDNHLYTEELLYSATQHQFLTDKDVRVVRPSGVTLGRGLKASEDLSDIKIFHQRSRLKFTRSQ